MEYIMRLFLLKFILVFFTSSIAFGMVKDFTLSEDYDPRNPMRIVVLPTEINVKAKGVDPATISNLLATHLLTDYDIIDLDRLTQFLIDNKLDLATAFTVKGKSLVVDSAGVDAIINLEIYMWQEGSPGFFGQNSIIGMRCTCSTPFSSNLIWSMNYMVEDKNDATFYEAATRQLGKMAKLVKKRLNKDASSRTKAENDVYMLRLKKILQLVIKGFSAKEATAIVDGASPYYLPYASQYDSILGKAHSDTTVIVTEEDSEELGEIGELELEEEPLLMIESAEPDSVMLKIEMLDNELEAVPSDSSLIE